MARFVFVLLLVALVVAAVCASNGAQAAESEDLAQFNIRTVFADEEIPLANDEDILLSEMEDVALADNIEPLSEVEAYSEVFAETEAYGTCRQTTAALNVRSGKGTTFRVLKTLPAGSKVTVSATSNGWAQIGSGQFVSAQYLKACSSSPAPAPKPAPAPAGGKCAFDAPLYKQCGQSWSNQYIRTDTVCQSGCLMSSVAMGMSRFGKTVNGSKATPGTLNTWLKGNGGYSGNLFIWGAVSRFGLHYQGQTSSLSTIRSRICQGNTIVVINLRSRGHWVLARGLTANGDILVNDPGFTRTVLPASDVRLAGVYTL